jgi:hypothetical protein
VKDELTLEEARDHTERQSQRHFDLSVEQFVAAVKRGEFDGNAAAIHIAMLIGPNIPRCTKER